MVGSHTMERLEAISRGRVQLVMYRDFVTRKARKLGLVGTVQNMKDGTVKTVAEGEKEALLSLVEYLRKGSFLSHVERVEHALVPAQHTFTAFTICYD